MKMSFSNRNKVLLVLAVIITLVIAFSFVFLSPYPAEQSFLDEVYSDERVQISENSSWYEIKPDEALEAQALIFYPGGLVSADAYLYKLTRIAIESKTPVFIVKFPLSLAVININAADGLVSEYPEIDNWSIAGHSLGGSMACRYAKEHKEQISKLILMASYCDQSISEDSIKVLSIYGSSDGVLNISNLYDYKSNLPQDFKEVEISGMNHAQFGNYGEQSGDNTSEIGDDQATEKIQEAVVEFLKN